MSPLTLSAGPAGVGNYIILHMLPGCLPHHRPFRGREDMLPLAARHSPPWQRQPRRSLGPSAAVCSVPGLLLAASGLRNRQSLATQHAPLHPRPLSRRRPPKRPSAPRDSERLRGATPASPRRAPPRHRAPPRRRAASLRLGALGVGSPVGGGRRGRLGRARPLGVALVAQPADIGYGLGSLITAPWRPWRRRPRCRPPARPSWPRAPLWRSTCRAGRGGARGCRSLSAAAARC